MEYRSLLGKIEGILEDIEASDDVGRMLGVFLRRLSEDFRDELGIVAGRLYQRDGNHYVLKYAHPQGGEQKGFRVPIDYAPIQTLLYDGFVLLDNTAPEIDRDIEDALGVRVFAAISVDLGRCIIAFSLRSAAERERVVYTLNAIRHVINLKLGKLRLENRVAEVQSIQLSLLPRASPRFGDYDIHGRSDPAEEVGGDLYDYLRVSDSVLGLAVVDSVGHGLPAALQARDAIIGLRMGVEDELRMTTTIEKLNRVVSRSSLASKFISLVYCEMEIDGSFAYCNAGAPPPLLLQADEFQELDVGGRVLGPVAESRYRRGHVQMAPESVLVLYTDGITEAEDTDGNQFGTARLRDVIRRTRDRAAEQIVHAVFAAVRDFSGVETPIDDQTVVVVRRG